MMTVPAHEINDSKAKLVRVVTQQLVGEFDKLSASMIRHMDYVQISAMRIGNLMPLLKYIKSRIPGNGMIDECVKNPDKAIHVMFRESLVRMSHDLNPVTEDTFASNADVSEKDEYIIFKFTGVPAVIDAGDLARTGGYMLTSEAEFYAAQAPLLYGVIDDKVKQQTEREIEIVSAIKARSGHTAKIVQPEDLEDSAKSDAEVEPAVAEPEVATTAPERVASYPVEVVSDDLEASTEVEQKVTSQSAPITEPQKTSQPPQPSFRSMDSLAAKQQAFHKKR